MMSAMASHQGIPLIQGCAALGQTSKERLRCVTLFGRARNAVAVTNMCLGDSRGQITPPPHLLLLLKLARNVAALLVVSPLQLRSSAVHLWKGKQINS